MKRKSISILLLLTFLISLFPLNIIVAYASFNIKIGDYIQMGTYYGKPILWRCVDIDENGPLMLSDKIICAKPFDASGTNISGSHGRGYYYNGTQGYYRKIQGSNYWADSNMRCWLNSTATAGNVVWACGNSPDESHVWNGYNEYDDEAGFLTNFTQSERSAMKTVTQKSLLNGYEYASGSSNTRDSNYHRDNTSIGTVVQNYDTAFSEQVTDTMFLLDVKQVNEVYNNRSILGSHYYIGKPTAECVANSEYNQKSSLSTGKEWHYWLRSPDAAYGNGYVRRVHLDGVVDYSSAVHGYNGVRPAFYLADNATFSIGNGSVNNPYRVINGIAVSFVSMMSPSATIKVGDTYQAMAYCMPTNATDKALTWSTSNPLVATVNNNGVVTAKGPGKATITAKSNNGKKASCIVTVSKQNVIDYDDFKYNFSNDFDSFGYPYHYDEDDVEKKHKISDYKIPKERYMQLGYAEAKAKAIVKDNPMWGGNCFGMSTSSILFYKNNIQEERYNSSIKTPNSFEDPKTNNATDTKLRQMIELMQISQEVSIGGQSYENKAFSASDVAKEIDNGNPVLLSLLCARNSLMDFSIGGHAVVIYNYTKSGDSYIFDIYDCSNYIKSLSYNGPLDYTFTITNDKYLWYIRSYCNYDSIIDMCARIYNNNSNGAASLFSLRQEPTYTYIFRPAENLTITNSSGQTSTISNGELLGEIDDTKLIPSSYLAEEPTYTIILPTDTYTIVGSGDEVVTTSFADDYMSASVMAKSSTPITITSDLKEISVDTAAEEEYDIIYTTYDNIFDEMNLSGTATGTVISTFNDADITITGVNTLTASASVSDVIVSTNSGNLAESNEIIVKCEESNEVATIQILSADAELTDKTSLPERLAVDTPAYDLASGTYTEGQVLNFTKDDETIIYYTTDGSIPSTDNGIIYSLPIDINKSMTVKALSTKYGYLDSEILELNYTLPEVDTPQADVEPGEYDTVITVELSTDDYEDTIYYTLDGSNPLENGILYTVPINISEDTYLQAYTLRNGCISEISEYEYTVAPTYPFYFSNSLTNQDGEIITSDNIADVTKVKMTLSKLHTGDQIGIFLIAFYGADNRLIYANYKSATISENIDEVEIDITEDVSSAYKVKVFAWKDLLTIEPICEALEENIIIE